MASSVTPGAAVAATVGIATSAYISGSIGSLSLLTIPALVATPPVSDPDLLAKQWASMYYLGRAINPRISLLALAGYGYLAYHAYSTTNSTTSTPTEKKSAATERKVQNGLAAAAPWIAAAVLTVGIVPFTAVVMSGTNDQLLGIADGVVKGVTTRAGVEALLERWATLNLMRGFLPLGAVVVGAWGLFGGLLKA